MGSGAEMLEDKSGKSKAELILFQRARVVKKAKDKLRKFEVIVSKLISEGRISGTVVFYEDEEQLRLGNEKLNMLGVRYAVVSAQIGELDRELVKERFMRGDIDCVCSMRVYDEGVNIESIRNEVILSSSVNQRQLVQRVGRAIRKAENKGEVRIYEVAAAVSDYSLEEGLREAERSIVSNEVQRMVLISKAAKNELECYNSLEMIATKLKINIWEYI
jgi:superfamily II DNA or RNA helicase